MNTPTLARRFEQCAQALRGGEPGEALRTLESIDIAGLSAAATALHAHLLTRAQHALTARSYGGSVEMPGGGEVTLLNSDNTPPLPGVSIVTACMNRQSNLLKVLPSWLESGADEIIIVDWSSAEPVWPMIAHIDDPRLRVVRIDHEKRWILTHAFNVGLRLAKHEVVFKLDADICIEGDFLRRNPVPLGTFVRGFWKSAVDAGEADQKYINGSFGCRKVDLRAASYYDERIVTYGWDDSDLYGRLSHGLGLAGHLLARESLHHLEQDDLQRLENQDVSRGHFLNRFAPTEHENLVNKFYSVISGDWGIGCGPQDFTLMTANSRLWAGFRTSALPVQSPHARRLAQMLAAGQLLRSSGDLFPHLPWACLESLEFARLLSEAKALSCDAQLVQALSDRRNIHIFRCSDPVLSEAVRHTLDLLKRHNPVLGQAIVIIEEHAGPDSPSLGVATHLRASGTLLDALETSVDATAHADIAVLESVLLDGNECTSWTITFDNLAMSAQKKANDVSAALASYIEPAASPAAASAVVTSVYDERNLLRLIEYLGCVLLNLRVVERVLLCYEARAGTFQMVMQRLCERLNLPVHRLALFPLQKRPTFEALFALQSLLPPGTRLAVCNADVAFDATFHRLVSTPGGNLVYAISRWDIAADGCSAQPIRLENGTPNSFSADAWIATTPFEPDFYLDYPIGTMHCDSFIYNQVGRSARYQVVNPCLDVHVFHLHDSRFNSSAEKSVRDKAEIQRRWEDERVRNGGEIPVKGAPWSYLDHCLLTADSQLLLDWRPRGLVLDFPQFTLGAFLWTHLLVKLMGEMPHLSIVVRLPLEIGAGAVGRLLARYKQHYRLAGLQFDVARAPTTPDAPGPAKICTAVASASELIEVLVKDGASALTQRLDALTRFPADSSIHQVRADLHIESSAQAQLKLVRAVAAQTPDVLKELQEFVGTLEAWSDESRLLRPFETDLFESPPAAPALHIERPIVSFVTSLFRGDAFLPGYLENVAHAALEAQGEVVLVDANCDDHDREAIDAFFRSRPELRQIFHIIHLENDPGLYACWQLAIERARGEFISNANLDDRRSPSHTRRLVELLQAKPKLAGACGSISAVTHSAEGGWFDMVPNQVWFHDLGSHDFGFNDLFRFNADGTVRSHNIMHCMPVWRRRLHERFGYFDEAKYGTSADWAFWLVCARAGQTFHLDHQAFGRYYLNPDSHNRRNDADGAKERRIIDELIGVRQESFSKQ